jgi:hypothetical protein
MITIVVLDDDNDDEKCKMHAGLIIIANNRANNITTHLFDTQRN